MFVRRYIEINLVDASEESAQRRDLGLEGALQSSILPPTRARDLLNICPSGTLPLSAIEMLNVRSSNWALRTGLPANLGDGQPAEGPWFISEAELVEQCGRSLFGSSVLNPDFFVTFNVRIFQSEYFPNYVANHGSGIYLDERIDSGLRTLRVIPPNSHVARVYDLGGWENLDRLDARLRIQLDGPEQFVVVGSPLLPLPPLTIKEREDVLLNRARLLDSAQIRHSFINVSRGVVIQYEGKSVFEWLTTADGPARTLGLQSMGRMLRKFRDGVPVAPDGAPSMAGPFDDLDVDRFFQSWEMKALFTMRPDGKVAWRDIRFDPLTFLAAFASDQRRVEHELLGMLEPNDFAVVWSAYGSN